MKKLRITATLNIQNKSYSGVKNHVTHDQNIKHSNQDIKFDKTQFNQSEILINEKELTQIKEERYQKAFEKYNATKLKSRHKSMMFKDVNEYVKSKEKKNSFDKSLVATFGNKEDQDELLKDKSDDEIQAILKQESQGMANYAKSFNERNQYLKIGQFTTNVDESTPHLHAQVIPLGRTAKGKPSMSLNNALKAEYKLKTGENVKDSRKALSWFREQEDNSLVSHVKESLNRDYELTRTHEHVADFDNYKKIKEELDNRSKVVKKQEYVLQNDKKEIKNYKTETTDLIKTYEPTHKIKPTAKIEEPSEVQTEKGYKEHLNSPVKNLFHSAIQVIKRTAEREFKKIREFNKRMKSFAEKFYKKNYGYNDNERNIITDFDKPDFIIKDQDNKRTKVNKLDFLFDKMNDKNKSLDKREHALDEREKTLKVNEENVEQRHQKLTFQYDEVKKYKEKLVAQEIKNNNFQNAKQTQNINMDNMEDTLQEKLKKARKIKKQESNKNKYQQVKQQQIKKQNHKRGFHL